MRQNKRAAEHVAHRLDFLDGQWLSGLYCAFGRGGTLAEIRAILTRL
jgi:hypothetical protein